MDLQHFERVEETHYQHYFGEVASFKHIYLIDTYTVWRQILNSSDFIQMTNHVWKYSNHGWSAENPLRVTNLAGLKRQSLFIGSSIIHVNEKCG